MECVPIAVHVGFQETTRWHCARPYCIASDGLLWTSSNYHMSKLRDSSFDPVTRSEEMIGSLGLDVLVHGTFALLGNHEETRRDTVLTNIFRKS